MMVLGLVLVKDQVPPMFQELFDCVAEPADTVVPLATERFLVRLPPLVSAKSKPLPPLSHEVQCSARIAPGLELSMKPPAELSHAMLLRTMCAAGRSTSPPPS